MTKISPNPAAEVVPVPSQRLSPRALLEIKRLSDPQIHPDGQRVAFTVYEADFEESRWVSHLWLTEYLPSDLQEETGSTEEIAEAAHDPEDATEDKDTPPTADDLTRQLTFSTEGETDPLWSPDGRHLAFMSVRPDTTAAVPDDDDDDAPHSQIWALPMEGGESRRVTSTKEAILDFCWTPDGLSLVYMTLEPRPRPIESVRRDRIHRKVDPIVEHDDPRRRQFWRVAVEERKPQLLFTADYGVEAFALSPEGGRIAYLTNYTGEENDYHIADLYLRDLQSGATVKLVRREGGKYRLRWSPDGSQIAFLSWHDPQLSYSRESAYTAVAPSREDLIELAQNLNAATHALGAAMAEGSFHDIRNAMALIEAPGISECLPVSRLDFDITSFEWLEGAGGILALAAVGTSTPLYNLFPGASDSSNPAFPSHSTALSTVSESPLPLTNKGSDRRDLAVHRETGRAVWVEESSAHPPEIVLRDADGQEHALTQINAHIADSYRLPRQEVVSWTAPDGQNIEGVLTYPPDYASDSDTAPDAPASGGMATSASITEGGGAILPNKRVPLIVQVHGGPKGRATDTLLDYPMPAVWASEGYLVLRPNYRGSEGYGHDFAVANRRDLGGADFSDIMSGVDWAVGEGLADPERIGILGGSYGGYMANWAIGHTDRFKAAISMFGIFHLQTDYSNSRLSRWEHDYMGAYYWEDPDIYRKLSPASFLESIRTPTLIIHGDEDDNTSISNSREIYRALLQRGVPAQFVHYPREGHGIQEPNHRLDELRRSLAWMDKYVRGGDKNPKVYRIGDRVRHANGRLELSITSAETAAFLGQHGQKATPAATALLEVAFTIHSLDPAPEGEPLTLRLADIRLEDAVGAVGVSGQVPIGVPLDLPGGKILVEGENLRIVQRPDPETGELAFAMAVVFRVPKSGACLLQIADFDAVASAWMDSEDSAPEED